MGPLSVFCAVIFLSSLATSFILPRSLPDGEYRVRYDAFGQQVIEPLTPALIRRDAENILASGQYVNASGLQVNITFDVNDPQLAAAISDVRASVFNLTLAVGTALDNLRSDPALANLATVISDLVHTVSNQTKPLFQPGAVHPNLHPDLQAALRNLTKSISELGHKITKVATNTTVNAGGVQPDHHTKNITLLFESITSQTSSILTSHLDTKPLAARSWQPLDWYPGGLLTGRYWCHSEWCMDRHKHRTRSWCWCGTNSDHTDVDDMKQAMRTLIDQQLGHQVLVPLGTGYWHKKGSVTGFICSLRKKQNTVQALDVETWDYGIRFIRGFCGPFVPGTYAHGGKKGRPYDAFTPMVHYGFVNERFYNGQEICEHVTDPPKKHCHGCKNGRC